MSRIAILALAAFSRPSADIGSRADCARRDIWGYHEALAHFCARTKISFDPSPPYSAIYWVCEEMMNCALISKMIGYTWHPLTEDGSVALIDTPFKFTDGDDVPAYVELGPDCVRFFDDGDVFFHFLGRGIPVDDDGGAQLLSEIATSNDVSYSATGNVEIAAATEDSATAFAKYMAAMLAFVSWEEAWEAIVGDDVPVSMIK